MYILNHHGIAIPCQDHAEWAVWMGTNDRTVKKDAIDNLVVSTVFLGLDHNHQGGTPLLFETMVFADEDFGNPVSFGPKLDDEAAEELRVAMSELGFSSRRYSFRDEALAGHEQACKEMRKRIAAAKKAAFKITALVATPTRD